MAGRPYAVFDIDGTLIRWQLYHALADELARAGHLNGAAFQKVREARMHWKTRASGTSFRDYEQQLVQLIDDSIAGIAPADFEAACRRVVAVYRDQVYTYTRDLIKELKAKEYLLFAISASQAEIVRLVADHYGFDDFGGTRYEVKNGRFTGNKSVLLRGKKPELLRRLISKHGAVQGKSLGVGDSESDIPMLGCVERPIAFNPTDELFEHAKQQRWQIVVERKNVIYRLEPGHHGYRLV